MEIAAVLNTDLTVWTRMADAIDPRLQRVSLKQEKHMSELTAVAGRRARGYFGRLPFRDPTET